MICRGNNRGALFNGLKIAGEKRTVRRCSWLVRGYKKAVKIKNVQGGGDEERPGEEYQLALSR